MNLAMIGALGKMHEWEIHCRGAINNGVSMEEIRAIIHVVGIYCGVPQSLECFRVARSIDRRRHASGRITAVCLCEGPPDENCPYFCLSTRFTVEQTLLPEWWAVTL